MDVGRADEHQVPGLQGLYRLVYQVQGLAVGDQEDLEKVVGVQGRGLADAVLLQEPHLGLGVQIAFVVTDNFHGELLFAGMVMKVAKGQNSTKSG